MPTIILPSVGHEVAALASSDRPFSSTRKTDEMAEAVRIRLAAQPSALLPFRESTELQDAVAQAASKLTYVSVSKQTTQTLRKKEQAQQQLERTLRKNELAERRRINERMSRALGLDRPRTVSLMSSPLNSARAGLGRPLGKTIEPLDPAIVDMAMQSMVPRLAIPEREPFGFAAIEMARSTFASLVHDAEKPATPRPPSRFTVTDGSPSSLPSPRRKTLARKASAEALKLSPKPSSPPSAMERGTYTGTKALYAAIEAGDVALLRATWILRRAGYTLKTVQMEISNSLFNAHADEVAKGKITEIEYDPIKQIYTVEMLRWTKDSIATPLPNRQQLEAEEPEAFITVDELKAAHKKFQRMLRGAKQTTLQVTSAMENRHILSEERLAERAEEAKLIFREDKNFMPIVSVSHCWETNANPDPEAFTLCTVASELAGSWRDLTPTGGLPLYQSWGMEDVGVFIDFSSIHQARLAADQKTLLPRFPAEQKSYGRAVSGMSGWFANLNTTLYLVFGQDRRLSRPRAERGWPTYEERMASLLKQAPTPETYQLASGKHQTLWPKTVILNGKTLDASIVAPPLAPSLFASELKQKYFMNSSDETTVDALYSSTMHEGFQELISLAYPYACWEDADVEQLATSIQEVGCANLQVLDLQGNLFTTLGPLGIAAANDALPPSLRVLNLSACSQLDKLPEQLMSGLGSLTTLILRDSALMELPANLGELRSLKELDMKGCVHISRLPQSIGELSELRILNMNGCRRISSLTGAVGKLRKLELLDMFACSLIVTYPLELLRLMQARGDHLAVVGLPKRGKRKVEIWAKHEPVSVEAVE